MMRKQAVIGFLYEKFKNHRRKKTASLCGFFRILLKIGALREIRTPDPLVRSQVLYPAEL